MTPTEIFECLWDWEWFSDQEKIKLTSRASQTITISLLKRYFGGIIIRGTIGCCSFKDLYGYGPVTLNLPENWNLVPRNVFHDISTKMVFNETNLLTIHTGLVDNFQKFLVPGTHTCIDEIRIPSRHYKNEVKKYNCKKPDVWAIESKSLNDSTGYLLDFGFPLAKEQGSTVKSAVLKFINFLSTTGRRHTVTLDSNFLNADEIPLLSREKIFLHAMCSSNRPAWLFKDGLQKELPRSYTRVASSENYVAAATFNNGKANIASNCFVVHDTDENFTPSKRRELLKYYDQTKGFSDAFGQLVKSYWPDQKFKSWELCMVFGWMKYALTNAFILHKLLNEKSNHREFLFEIGSQYLLIQEE